MTMYGAIIAVDVDKSGAKFLIENNGLAYKALLDAPLGRNTNFVKKSSTAGRRVRIEFSESSTEKNSLILESIDFLNI